MEDRGFGRARHARRTLGGGARIVISPRRQTIPHRWSRVRDRDPPSSRLVAQRAPGLGVRPWAAARQVTRGQTEASVRWCMVMVGTLALGCRTSTTDTRRGETAEPRVCDEAAVVEGTWAASGPPFGMPMDTVVAFDPEQCRFTTDGWNLNGVPMSHDSSMWGGFVDGDQIAVFGSVPFWDSCTGTLDAGGTHMSGVCSDANEGVNSWDLLLKE
jgi:hypothetical protein